MLISHCETETRYEKLRAAVAGLTTLAAFAVPFAGCGDDSSEDRDAGKQYNILWIDGDDLSVNLAAYGDASVSTPNIDRLAAEGIVYDNYFVTNAQCSPVRSSLHTGMYPTTIGTHQMRNNTFRTDPSDSSTTVALEPVLPDGVKVFTEYMRQAGYYCAIQNKLDYQYGNALSAWDIAASSSATLPVGNDSAEPITDQFNGLWNRRASGQPFFAHMTFDHTHERFIWDKSCPQDNQFYFLSQFTASFEAGEIPSDVDLEKMLVPSYFPQDNDIVKADIARYYHQLMVVDSEIGQVLDQLEAEGDLDNTIIIFFGDNGRALPREKRTQWDSGLRVPLIVRWPDGRDAGTHKSELVSAVDLAPTTLNLANIEVPEHIQGKVFLGKNRDKEREYVYGHRDRTDDLYDKIRSVRDERFHYIRNYYPEISNGIYQPFLAVGALYREWARLYEEEPETLSAEEKFYFDPKPEEELYDTWNDPYELNNLADNQEYSEDKARLISALDKWIEETDIWSDLSGNKTMLEEETDMGKAMWPGFVQPIVGTPIFSKGSQTVSAPFSLTFDCMTAGASIVYTVVDSTVPADAASHQWKLYSGPIEITENCTVMAQAMRPGYKSSDVQSASYTFSVK